MAPAAGAPEKSEEDLQSWSYLSHPHEEKAPPCYAPSVQQPHAGLQQPSVEPPVVYCESDCFVFFSFAMLKSETQTHKHTQTQTDRQSLK